MMFSTLDFSPGKVVFNDLNFDLNKPLGDQEYSLKEDILQVNYYDKYIIDVGWYPEFNVLGNFKVSVIRDFDWAENVMI